MKKPTIKDIAAAAGVSPASVSMILNGKNLSRFTEQTIQNVYRSSRQLGYLSKKQQRHKNPKEMILIVCPSLMNPYYATLTQSMEQEARLRGYLTMIFTTYWDKASEREVLEMAAEPNVAGIIFSMIPQQPHLAEEVSKFVPMVAVGDRTYNLKLDTVDVNNYSAGRMVASHLIGLGHKHIAYISTTLNEEHSSRLKRCDGLSDEYAQSCPLGTVTIYTQDVSSHKELYVTGVEHEVGYALAQKCLAESPHITAMVAINDMVSYGVRAALIDAGKRIPEDMSLCGFDNIYPSRFPGVDLTTIEHAIVERGRSSIRLLSEKLRGESEFIDQNAITRVEYQSNLVLGSTTGPVRSDADTK
ncbi:MAG: LacI family transcriptional regulator [Hungatella sp.]|jgi:DNA-binding LacI/PurR family transcriptional regulator|nr:LacI family transcriptional regulator [Hungatella sp.]